MYRKCGAGVCPLLGGIYSAVITAPEPFGGYKTNGHDSAMHQEQTLGIRKTLWLLIEFDGCFFVLLENRAEGTGLKK